MDKLLDFFKGYFKIIGASGLTRKRTLSLISLLRNCDPYHKTKFEASFKLSKSKACPCARITNLDVAGYARISNKLFALRLNIYKEIIKRFGPVRNIECIFTALAVFLDNPLDIYFGADIQDKLAIFNIWLKFGNMRKNGDIQIFTDGHKIVKQLLKAIGFSMPPYMANPKLRPPEIRGGELFFAGLDLENKGLLFKLYYIIKKKDIVSARFASIIKYLDSNLSQLRYKCAYVYTFNRRGDCVKEKLCLEFQESIYFRKENLKRIFPLFSAIIDYKPESLMKLFETADMPDGVRLSIISFELDGTPTFYLIQG